MAGIINCVELSQAIKAEYVSFSENNTGEILSVSIDSRNIEANSLFVALIGEKQDGHNFVCNAINAGATAVMVDRDHWEDQKQGLAESLKKLYANILIVENTLKGLQKTATYYLSKFPKLLKVGITGSSGKTTTKEIAASIISTEKKVVMNMGNLNSETGLPLSVFQVRPFHEVGIFELGMNKPGEIEEITAVLKPHIALITNIGSAHIGFFGNKDAIAKEKKSIFSQFSGSEIALIPYNDPYRDFLAKDVNGKVVFFNSDPNSVRDLGINGFEIMWEGEKVKFPLSGLHNLKNAFSAIAIAKEIPVSSSAIRSGLSKAMNLFGRTEIIHSQKITLIRDCYNANPEATIAIIDMCDALKCKGKKIYVIGSMLELGSETKKAHEEVGRRLDDSNADIICMYGEEMRSAAELKNKKKPFFFTNDIEDLSNYLTYHIETGDIVLLKGSRALALERLTDVLIAEVVP